MNMTKYGALLAMAVGVLGGCGDVATKTLVPGANTTTSSSSGGGGGGIVWKQPTGTVGPQAPPTETPIGIPAPVATEATLRLHGIAPDGVTSLPVSVKQLEIKANGVSLPLSMVRTSCDLADVGQAYAVATFSVPTGVSQLEVFLRLGDGDAFTGPRGPGRYDARGVPIRMVADAAQVAASGKLALDVELGNSLVEVPLLGTYLLPQVVLRY